MCIGYSGGVDSVLLAQAALLALGRERVLAVTGVSASVSAAQLEVARACARQLDLPHLEIQTRELSDPNYAANPANRCYFCKSELWARLHQVAAERCLRYVLDGSNGVAMTVGFARYGKGSSNAWTVTYDEALVITQGTFSVDTADGTTTASAGQIIYLEAGTELVYRADEDCELAFVTYPHWQQATQESEFASRLDDFHPVPASSATWPS